MRESAEETHSRHSVAVALLRVAEARSVGLDMTHRRDPGHGDRPGNPDGEWVHAERMRFGALDREPPRPSPSALAAGRMADAFGGDTARVRCLHLAAAVLAGDVPAGERDWVKAALADDADGDVRALAASVREPPAEAPMTAGPVPFSFARPVSARGGAAAVRAEGLSMVREVRVAEAPLACRLARPGGWLDVRMHAGGFIRPVLSPGSWEPMGMAAFARAAAEAPAWVDSPFTERPGAGAVAVALADVAAQGPPPNAAGRMREADMATAALVRAGTLLLVDGVVHRSAPAPVLGLAVRHMARGKGDRRARRVDHGDDGGLATWWMGGLHMLEDQGTVRPTHWDVDHQLWFPTGDGLPCVHGTPADAGRLAALVDGAPGSLHVAWIPGGPVAVDVDPAAFPEDGRFALRMLARGGWPLAADARALVGAAMSGAGDAAALRCLGEGAADWNLGRDGATRAVGTLLGMAAGEVDDLDPWLAAGMPGL